MSWIDDLDDTLTGANRRAPTDLRWATPGALAAAFDPDTIQTAALDQIDQALMDAASTPDSRLIITMPPQEGKSQRASRWFPLWCLLRNPATRIVLASFEHHAARRLGRQVRDTITDNSERLGLRVRRDLSSQSEWALLGPDGGMYSVGIGGALTSRPADILIIDDPVKDQAHADSETHREAVWDWWETVAQTRLSPGAPVVLILTRWHEDDLAGRILRSEDAAQWRELRIPAQADHDPGKGESDPLGRAPGEFLGSARRRTDRQWAAKKIQVGSRTWQAMYQGKPSPPGGGMLKRSWWGVYDEPVWIERDDGSRIVLHGDELIQSWDMAFKDTKKSDYVCGQVWLRRGSTAYLLDQKHARMDFPETLKAVRALTARWPQATLKLVEDKANGTAVLSMLTGQIAGMVPVEPRGSKVARASAVSPLIEAGNVLLPAVEIAPWIDGFIEEAASFPTGAHDDQVDAMTQALDRLLVTPLTGEGSVVTDEQIDEELRGFNLVAY